MLLVAISSIADPPQHSCQRMTRDNRYLNYIHNHQLSALDILSNLPRWSLVEIDLSAYAGKTDLERGYLQAVNVYTRDWNKGSISAAVHQAVLELLDRLAADDPQFWVRHSKLIAELESRKPFGAGVNQAFKSLVEKKHKPSLRCLGHVYRYGIGVAVDLAKAWGFYDTYNLVAGIDGIDEFRDAVSEHMTDLQILEGQGLARTYRELYTDAWKVPSMTIIR